MDASEGAGREMVGRLFIGIALPGEVREALEHHLRIALGNSELPGRAVPPENWHLTLRFLGDTDANAHTRLVQALAALRPPAAFSLELAGVGAFPRPARASVLWIGIGEGSGRLQALAAAVAGATESAGFEPAPLRFSPHLTLSRIRPPADVRRLLERLGDFSARWPVREIVLFRSRLGSGPARYEPLRRWPLP